MTAAIAAVSVPEALLAAVLAVPGVARMSGGRFGEVASYLPGRRVTGIRVAPECVTVHIVLRPATPALPVAKAVRHAVRALAGAVRVDIGIDDIQDAGEIVEIMMERTSP
jgi:hypothetical protein